MSIVKTCALLFSVLVLTLGYVSFGFWTTMILTSGFIGGYALWLISPARPSFDRIKVPYYLAFAIFILHRIEEKYSGFFDALSGITGLSTPDILSWHVILLVVASVVAWLGIPYLVKRKYEFGHYLAWTFFTAMGITELAHFILPLYIDRPYGYFPGMASVLLLAPVAWWGIYRLIKQ